MFPFTLGGPQFLGFYALFAAVVLAAYFYYRSSLGETSATPRLTELTSDPYRIVFLRADRGEAVRVAVVNLVDRGLLEWSGATVVAKGGGTDFVRRSLDRAILNVCAGPRTVAGLETDPRVAAACAEYERDLETKGLVLGQGDRFAASAAFTVVLLVLVGVGGARLIQGFVRGHSNIIFLLLLGAVAVWIAHKLDFGPATPAGRHALNSLQTLTERVKRQIDKLRAGGATNEALLLAAVFGIYALPAAFSFVEQMFPRSRPGRSDGSSCGSSSCGSSCGGGGSCGGGCGGCGG
jgi:uncharacterized protein (TIGR04222 family)